MDISKASIKELKSYIKNVGKAQNQRLRELEKKDLAKSSLAYKHIEKLDYMHDDAISKTRKGQIKFNLRVRTKDINQLRHQAKLIHDFANAKTSTPTGIKNMTYKGFEKFKKEYESKFGTEYDKDFRYFAEFYTNEKVKRFSEMYGSQETFYLQNQYGETIATEIISQAVDFFDENAVKKDIEDIYEDGEQYMKEYENAFSKGFF